LAHPKNSADTKTLAPSKSLADAKTSAHPKSLADAKTLAHPKSLAETKTLASKIFGTAGKAGGPAEELPYCLGSAESATANFSQAPLTVLFSSLLMC
jgi:hypothetical protein